MAYFLSGVLDHFPSGVPRKRLRRYAAAEGLTETVVIDIPLGSYRPVVRYREAASRAA